MCGVFMTVIWMFSAPPVGKTVPFPCGVQDHTQPRYFVWECELLYLLLSSLGCLGGKMPVEQLFHALWLQIDLIIDPFGSLQCSCAELTWAEPQTRCHVFTANSSVEERSPTGESGRVVVSQGRSLEENHWTTCSEDLTVRGSAQVSSAQQQWTNVQLQLRPVSKGKGANENERGHSVCLA